MIHLLSYHRNAQAEKYMPPSRIDNKQALAQTSDAEFPRSVLTFLHSLGIALAAAVAHLYSGKPSNPLVLSRQLILR